jgi:hypothetical protein
MLSPHWFLTVLTTFLQFQLPIGVCICYNYSLTSLLYNAKHIGIQSFIRNALLSLQHYIEYLIRVKSPKFCIKTLHMPPFNGQDNFTIIISLMVVLWPCFTSFYGQSFWMIDIDTSKTTMVSPTHVLECDPNETNFFSICPFVNSHENQWSFWGEILAFCEKKIRA